MEKTLSSLSLALVIGFTALLCTGCLVVQETGQTEVYRSGDNGDKQTGTGLSPEFRFTVNENGTVTDNLTRLIWVQNAGCNGLQTWDEAIDKSLYLEQLDCGLGEGHERQFCRLPHIRELSSLIDFGAVHPAIPVPEIFQNLEDIYWSSTTYDGDPDMAWTISMGTGLLGHTEKTGSAYLLAVCRAPE